MTADILTNAEIDYQSALVRIATGLFGRAGAGADFVMMGGMLAGHDQCLGDLIERNGKKFKLFYGMSSDTAMKKYVGGVAEYR